MNSGIREFEEPPIRILAAQEVFSGKIHDIKIFKKSGPGGFISRTTAILRQEDPCVRPLPMEFPGTLADALNRLNPGDRITVTGDLKAVVIQDHTGQQIGLNPFFQVGVISKNT